jgi:threonine/homoserine/homoserine lactone efflux protein
MWPRLALVLPLMMAYGLASNFTYALLGSALRGWLSQGARLQWFNRSLAGVLVATAVWMAWL